MPNDQSSSVKVADTALGGSASGNALSEGRKGCGPLIGDRQCLCLSSAFVHR